MSKLKVENGKFKIISALSGKDNTNANKVVNIKRYTSCRTRFGISKIASDSRLIATALEMLKQVQHDMSVRNDMQWSVDLQPRDCRGEQNCRSRLAMTCGLFTPLPTEEGVAVRAERVTETGEGAAHGIIVNDYRLNLPCHCEDSERSEEDEAISLGKVIPMSFRTPSLPRGEESSLPAKGCMNFVGWISRCTRNVMQRSVDLTPTCHPELAPVCRNLLISEQTGSSQRVSGSLPCHPELVSGSKTKQIPKQVRDDMIVRDDMQRSVDLQPRDCRGEQNCRSRLAMTCGAKAALLSFAVARASSSLRQDGSRSGCPHILGFHPSAKAAFSLVEAMIILVLISVAIMMLIPLLGPQKMSVPAWKDNNNTIFYQSGGSVDRVGVGVNPFDEDIPPAKLAVTTMAVTNTANNTNSIEWGDNYVSNMYCGKSDNNCTQGSPAQAVNDSRYMFNNGSNYIKLGMNTCSAVDNSSKIIINSNATTNGAGSDACNGANLPNININNAILQVGSSLGITTALQTRNVLEEATVLPNDTLTSTANRNANTATDSIIYIKSNGIGNKDIFRINFADNNRTPAMWYNGTTLAILPSGGNMLINGNLFMAAYYPSNAGGNVSGTFPVNCDDTDGDGECESTGNIHSQSNEFTYDNDIITNYLNTGEQEDSENPKHPNETNSFITSSGGDGDGDGGDGDGGEVVTPSDIRLKNILSEYTKGVKDILKVDTYTYSYKSDKENKTYVGIIAQKLKGIFDEALHKDEKGFYSYERTPLLYAMTNSVKDIHTKQSHIENEQNRTAKEADRLIKMYK